MTAWTSDELTTIGAAEERRIAPHRRDGTLRRPLMIRVLRHGDDLYVRSVNGRAAAWFGAPRWRPLNAMGSRGSSKNAPHGLPWTHA